MLVGCEPSITPRVPPTLEPGPEPTKTPTIEPTPERPPHDASLGDTWTRPTDSMVMVYVPAGAFEMGSIDGDEDEAPVHSVSLDSFWIDRTEVTISQYEECVNVGVCKRRVSSWTGADTVQYCDKISNNDPAMCVTWYQADIYCNWAGVRQPTEAEWEYAARGPSGRVFPWGDEFDGTRLNYCDDNCERVLGKRSF